MTDHAHYLSLAECLCHKSPMTFKVGAILLDHKGRIIGSGHNSYQTHPKYGTLKTPYRFMHAEGACLYNCVKQGFEPEGGTMYIYRRNWNLARPCKYCQDLLREAGVERVIYTDKTNERRRIIVVEERFDVIETI